MCDEICTKCQIKKMYRNSLIDIIISIIIMMPIYGMLDGVNIMYRLVFTILMGIVLMNMVYEVYDYYFNLHDI